MAYGGHQSPLATMRAALESSIKHLVAIVVVVAPPTTTEAYTYGWLHGIMIADLGGFGLGAIREGPGNRRFLGIER